MRKVISTLLVTILVINMIIATSFMASTVESPNGAGISSANDFASMAVGGEYYLNSNITISATYLDEFSGVLDGNGHTLTVSSPLFSTISGTVKNLIVEGVIDCIYTTETVGAVANIADNAKFLNITNRASVCGSGITGGVVGEANGNCSFQNVSNEGEIRGNQTGGIAGSVKNSTEDTFVASNCINTGNIISTTYAGGVFACLNSVSGCIISGCVNEGNIESLSNSVGGIIGLITQPNVFVKNCTNRGNVTGALQTGGIVGYSYYALSFENCLNDSCASISGNGTGNYSGGIISRIGNDNSEEDFSLFKNCINKGSVTSTKDFAGGILAVSNKAAYFQTCYNFGDVTGKKSTGGISGSITFYADFINCINYGNVISTNDKAGGISGDIGSISKYSHMCMYERCGNEGNVQGYKVGSGIAAFIYGGNNKSLSFKFCYNVGNITSSKSYVTGIIGSVIGVADPIIAYNYIKGSFTPASGFASFATVYNDSDRTSDNANQTNNYILSGCFEYLCHNKDFGDIEIPTKYKYFFNNSDLSSGKLAVDINTSAGEDVFFQTLNCDTYPTTNKSHHAVRLSSSYINLLKATFINGNDVLYIDIKSGENFLVLTAKDVLYWNTESEIIIPGGTYQIQNDKIFIAKILALETDKCASVRMIQGSTGMRFYTYINKSNYDDIRIELADSSYIISYGTVITPKQFADEATEFTMEALDGLTKKSIKYIRVEAGKEYSICDGNYVIAGSIVGLGPSEIKSDNRALDFAAKGYVCITNMLTDETFFLYSSTYSVRNVSSVATAALNDVVANPMYEYVYIVQDGPHNAQYSPYTAEQLALLESLVAPN